ncbi:MAG: glycosyltransferase [Chloroflexi bacterium]|nr:glycosyltransferase [Chloroflexota bacterium]
MAFLWKALRTCRDCEVVHAHWVFSGLIGLALAKFAPKPVVLTVHGSDLNVSSGNRLLRWLRRFVVLRVDRVIAVSKPLADKLRELGLPQERIVAIANGVDLRCF